MDSASIAIAAGGAPRSSVPAAVQQAHPVGHPEGCEHLRQVSGQRVGFGSLADGQAVPRRDQGRARRCRFASGLCPDEQTFGWTSFDHAMISELEAEVRGHDDVETALIELIDEPGVDRSRPLRIAGEVDQDRIVETSVCDVCRELFDWLREPRQDETSVEAVANISDSQ